MQTPPGSSPPAISPPATIYRPAKPSIQADARPRVVQRRLFRQRDLRVAVPARDRVTRFRGHLQWRSAAMLTQSMHWAIAENGRQDLCGRHPVDLSTEELTLRLADAARSASVLEQRRNSVIYSGLE
jgi:hypothetical protein